MIAMEGCDGRLCWVAATDPPVEVPPIRSKYSHGSALSPFSRLTTLKISRRIRSEVRPLTPPPSGAQVVSAGVVVRTRIGRYEPSDSRRNGRA